MVDPFRAREYGEHVTKTTGKTISASDFVKQPYIGNPDVTRNQAIDPKLEKILAQVANETGLTFVVKSGGQDPAGTPNARRTKSKTTRHDLGRAADVMAKDANGNFVDFTTPDGKKQWSSVVTRARSLGATGIGAGTGYMGPKTVHIGFGTPATWSSTASGQPVEPWLREAYNAGAKMPPGTIPDTIVATSVDVPRVVSRTSGSGIDRGTQDMLRASGFNPGASDGIFGPKTDAAVRAFQATHNLKVDGIVGDKTLAALQRASTSPQQAPSPVASRGVVEAPPNTGTPQIGSAFRPEQNGWGSNGFTYGWQNRGQPQQPGSAFRGGWGANSFNRRDPLTAAPPGSATGGGDWPPKIIEEPGFDVAGYVDTGRKLLPRRRAVATEIDVPRQRVATVTRPRRDPGSSGRNGTAPRRTESSMGETFDSVWNEAKG